MSNYYFYFRKESNHHSFQMENSFHGHFRLPIFQNTPTSTQYPFIPLQPKFKICFYLLFSFHFSLKFLLLRLRLLLSNGGGKSIKSPVSGQSPEVGTKNGPFVSSVCLFTYYPHFKERFIKCPRPHSENLVQSTNPWPLASRSRLFERVGPAARWRRHRALDTASLILHGHTCR